MRRSKAGLQNLVTEARKAFLDLAPAGRGHYRLRQADADRLDVSALLEAVASVDAEQLGIVDSEVATLPGFVRGTRTSDNAPISCVPLHAESTFEIALFCLPPSTCIPLHNHPNMMVFSKVLQGTVHSTSYDISSSDSEGRVLTGAKATNTLSTGDCAALAPTVGNIHQFRTAETSGAVILDILAPPYDFLNGRGCTYYVEKGRPKREARSDGDGMVVLQPVPEPASLHVIEGYLPSIWK